ncbi:GyrI-like domain-containing protein [Chryseomicrobium palamuruense]|uniref:GyrI-like domain-containing protein n=1 Tax=Chryseomicrobium palamuruense TaxID=682973 RepID=A0ABV8UWA0_9BACL
MVQIEMKQYLEGTEMKPKLVKRDAFTIVGFQFEASLKEVEQKRLNLMKYNELLLHKNLIQHRTAEEIIFIQSYPLIPDFNPKKDRFKHFMGYKVKRAIHLPENMSSYTVPACHYMKATHKGSPEEIHETHDFLYAFCQQHEEYTPLGFDLEEWDHTFNPFSGTNEVDIYLAVR